MKKEIIKAIASNPSTPGDTLNELMEKYKDDEDILFAIASNPSTPGYVLREIAAKTSNSRMLIEIINNPR